MSSGLAEKCVVEDFQVLRIRKKCPYCGASGTPEQMRMHKEIVHLSDAGHVKLKRSRAVHF